VNDKTALSLPIRLVVVAVVMLLAGAIAAVIGVLLFQTSLTSVLVALIACLAATLLAHVAGEYPRGDVYFAARLAIQLVVRAGIPFVVAVCGLYFVKPPLETNLVFYMILFYLVGLLTDVPLNLARLKANSQAA
jgi:hypothetical protein